MVNISTYYRYLGNSQTEAIAIDVNCNGASLLYIMLTGKYILEIPSFLMLILFFIIIHLDQVDKIVGRLG